MPYNLIPVSNKSQWNEVLSLCGQHDIYHTNEYHQIAQENGEGEAWLFWYWNGNNHVAIPLLLNGNKMTSAYGYSSIIAFLEKDYQNLDFGNCFGDFLVARNITSFFIRLHPILDYVPTPLDEWEQIGNTTAIDLTQPERDQFANMTKGHRYDIRKALKEGVDVWEDTEFAYIDEFTAMYYQTMIRNKAEDYYWFKDTYFTNLKKHLGDSVKLFFATKDDEFISGALFFFCNGIIQYHLSGTPDDQLSCGGPKAIINHVRKLGTEDGYKWLHLGGGLGASEESPLWRFKKGFGGVVLPFNVIRWEKKNA